MLIAVTDLAGAARNLEERHGLASVEGGRHPGWGEDPPDAGVREPLHPRPSPRGGAVQLPEPD